MWWDDKCFDTFISFFGIVKNTIKPISASNPLLNAKTSL